VTTPGGARFIDSNAGQPFLLETTASGGGGGTGFRYDTSVAHVGSDFLFDFESHGTPTFYGTHNGNLTTLGTFTAPTFIGALTGNASTASITITAGGVQFREGSTGQAKALSTSSPGGGGGTGFLADTTQTLNASDVAFGVNNNGNGLLQVTGDGNVSLPTGGKLIVPAASSAGSPGNATINKPAGRSAIAAGNNTMTLTNSYINSSSMIFVVMEGSDATAKSIYAGSPGSGVVNISLDANCTSNVIFHWWVLN
jgi:hypothetical protein